LSFSSAKFQITNCTSLPINRILPRRCLLHVKTLSITNTIHRIVLMDDKNELGQLNIHVVADYRWMLLPSMMYERRLVEDRFTEPIKAAQIHKDGRLVVRGLGKAESTLLRFSRFLPLKAVVIHFDSLPLPNIHCLFDVGYT